MPTLYKPEFRQGSFDWEEAASCLREALAASENVLFPQGGSPSEWDELIGILLHGAAIRIDGGHKAAGKILGTLRAIHRHPEEDRLEHIESEALGALASQYQRESEPPGTHWYDVTEFGGWIRAANEKSNLRKQQMATAYVKVLKDHRRNPRGVEAFKGDLESANRSIEEQAAKGPNQRAKNALLKPSPLQIKRAAANAIAATEREKKIGRPLDESSRFLAHGLAGWLDEHRYSERRGSEHRDAPKRIVEKDEAGFHQRGALPDLLDIVLPPLNELMMQYKQRAFSKESLLLQATGRSSEARKLRRARSDPDNSNP